MKSNLKLRIKPHLTLTGKEDVYNKHNRIRLLSSLAHSKTNFKLRTNIQKNGSRDRKSLSDS